MIQITKIADLIEVKKIQIKLTKIKSHSKDKWNDKADNLAKKGITSKKLIQIEKISCKKIEYCLEQKNK